VRKLPTGLIVEIKCKGCGKTIAIGEGRSMKRTPQYTEIKMIFPDGLKAVTHICKGCAATVDEDRERLLEMYNADVDLLAAEVPRLIGLKRDAKDGLPRLLEMMVGMNGIP
jgi:hypothetical protein